MTQWVTSAVNSFGASGVLVLMLLENLLPPIPSELIMPMAGFYAAQGRMSFWGVVAAGTAGSVLGAIPLYYLGRGVGRERLRRWVERRGHWLALAPGDLDKADAWFSRHCGTAVLLCRLIPGVRSLISIPAGLNAMPMPKFLLYTTLGTAAWSGALAYAGKLLGENYAEVGEWLGPLTKIVLGLLGVAYVVRVIRLRRARGARRAAGTAGDPAPAEGVAAAPAPVSVSGGAAGSCQG
jgi:membrane protein DedA with SNARE-associated domain